MVTLYMAQGLGPALLGNAVAWGGFFYSYEKIKVQAAPIGPHYLIVLGSTRVLQLSRRWAEGCSVRNVDIRNTDSSSLVPFRTLRTRCQSALRPNNTYFLYPVMLAPSLRYQVCCHLCTGVHSGPRVEV